jgi:hypothetical protein
MRYKSLSLIVIALLSTGCSALIAKSGDDLSVLTTKELVHAKFGNPSTSGIAEGLSFEAFRTRRHIADPVRASSCGMGAIMTCGITELIAFPYELSLLGRNAIVGQEIRFTYDSAGNVTQFHLPGHFASDNLALLAIFASENKK